ncbi:MAG: hypothetical protein AB8D52_13175 [Gammaproteobacteria bacterium]
MNQLSEGPAVASTAAAKVKLPTFSQLGDIGGNKATKSSDQNQVSRASPAISQGEVKLTSGDDRFINQQIRNEKFSEAATTFREKGKFLGAVGDQLDKKDKEIQQYEKQYPPFQNQSSERVEFINSIKSLKNQVDKLTLVKDYKDITSITNDSENEQGGANQQDKIGLKIASINPRTPDEDVIQVGRDVTLAGQKSLDGQYQELKATLERVSSEITSQGRSTGTEVFTSEQQATQKSDEVKQILSSLPAENLGGTKGHNILESLV